MSLQKFVVREWVIDDNGKKRLHTHHELGRFNTYQEAHDRAAQSGNPRCFPQVEKTDELGEFVD